ncbi:MAG TPA: hypothetical protein VG326_19900 [Tepidisphaeraceae bacterium]|nr:hypothetical protein [Tepidisphaeraceae bacterium]
MIIQSFNATESHRIPPFRPGATGWSAGDLDHPEIERQWVTGRYEIVEELLTKMAPAYFAGGNAAFRLNSTTKAGGNVSDAV